MAFETDEEPKPAGVFAFELVCLVVGPPLIVGLVVGTASGLEDGAAAALLGAIVGVGLASLRGEIRAARGGE